MSSIRKTARRIVNDRAAMSGDAYRADLKQVDAIEKALRDRDERAVRIIDDHQAQDKCEDNCWTTIKAAIRKED